MITLHVLWYNPSLILTRKILTNKYETQILYRANTFFLIRKGLFSEFENLNAKKIMALLNCLGNWFLSAMSTFSCLSCVCEQFCAREPVYHPKLSWINWISSKLVVIYDIIELFHRLPPIVCLVFSFTFIIWTERQVLVEREWYIRVSSDPIIPCKEVFN